MPIGNIEAVIPTMTEFIAHWNQVNSDLPAPLVLPGGYTVATLTTDRTAFQDLMIAVEVADNARQVNASSRDFQKAAMKERLRQFRGTVQGQLAGSTYVKGLPKLPTTNAKEQAFLRALEDASNLWSRVNATPPAGFTGPLILTGAYPVATFKTDLTALRTIYNTVGTTDEQASFARKERDAMIPLIKARLVQYRKAVAGAFAAPNPNIASLPLVYPPAGATPDPVNLAGVWDVSGTEADLTWSASTNPALDHYSVRYHPGPTYKAAEEQAVAVVPAGTHLFETDHGLPTAGSSAWFKVYVVLSTGNEKGSNAVKVVRP
jgi:hypothetical protein